MAEILNRRARFDYEISDEFEAGILLRGSEVKSLRAGQASLNEAFAVDRPDGLYLINASIAPYPPANRFNHTLKRERKLLLKKQEIEKIIGALTRERMTLIPLKLYFNSRGFAKCTLGLAKGKKKVDKRETIKERDWQRQKARTLRDYT